MMQNNRPIYFFVLMFAFFTSSCEDILGGENSLQIKNTTSNRIYYWYSRDYTVHHFPDTILPQQFPIQIGEVAANGSAGTGSTNPNWHQIFSELPQGYFTIYFFETKPRNQADWDLLKSEPEKIQRKDFTHEQFIQNDYNALFP